jgi:hypothetical protein
LCQLAWITARRFITEPQLLDDHREIAQQPPERSCMLGWVVA